MNSLQLITGELFSTGQIPVSALIYNQNVYYRNYQTSEDGQLVS